VQRLSYDAFGKRRNATTWSGALSAGDWTSIAALTHRAFTFHEQLDNVDLIHMNGRVYDPDLGRFISADPFVQAPLMSQSLNRYSYVMNNPLSLIDPSGYSWLSKIFKSIGKAISKIFTTIVRVVASVAVVVAAVVICAGSDLMGCGAVALKAAAWLGAIWGGAAGAVGIPMRLRWGHRVAQSVGRVMAVQVDRAIQHLHHYLPNYKLPIVLQAR